MAPRAKFATEPPCVPPTSRIEGRDVTGNMLDYTAHMYSIQVKYFNRDEEEKSGTQR
jgi:hypothetical protein